MSRRDHETRARVAREVDEELQFHIRMRAEENERRGMDPEQALREAERHFGDYERIARVSRYQRLAPRDPRGDGGFLERLANFADSLIQDVALAFRGFVRAPMLFGVAVVTLAIGLGATTGIFSLANFVLLRPVPGVADPGELSIIWSGQYNEDGSFELSGLSKLAFRGVAERTTQLSGITGHQFFNLAAVPPRGDSVSLWGQAVTDTYFEVLGVTPRIGRLFASDVDSAGEIRSVVISDRLWLSMFNRSHDVIGQTLRLNGYPFSVMGVTAQGFHGPELHGETDVWVRGESYLLLRRMTDGGREERWSSSMVGRLAPGSTWDQVEAELEALGAWLAQEYPDDNDRFSRVGFRVFRSFGVNPVGKPFLVSLFALLMAIGGLVLLIACANVANLLLVRCLGRQGEIALYKALGARGGRVLRQHLIEGVLLWMLGAVVGLGVAAMVAGLFVGSLDGFAGIDRMVFDARVVAFAALTALAVGVLFSIVPTLSALRIEPAGSLKGPAPMVTHRRIGLRSALAVAQLSASLILLVGMVLLVRSLVNVTSVDPGFEMDGVYGVLGSPGVLGYSDAEAFAYYLELERRLRLQPEVEAVSVVRKAPFRCCGFPTRIRLPGPTGEDEILRTAGNTVVTPGFFELLRIPVLHGRTFTEGDIAPPGGSAARVVVVNESLARRVFGEVNVVGRRVEFATSGREGVTCEVVGVVADIREGQPGRPVEPAIYEPSGLDPGFRHEAYVLIRVRAPVEVAAMSRSIAGLIDPALPIGQAFGLREAFDESRSQWTVLAKLMSLLASLAVVLAAIGLYGVVAQTVTSRAREFGIRLALGSEPRRIFSLVLRNIAGTIVVGLIIGLVGSAALVRVLGTYLYGVAPFDVIAWTLASAGLVLVALLAASLPARRATRVNPVESLRSL